MSRKNRLFAKLASTINNNGRLQETSLAADIELGSGGSTTAYADVGDLPESPSQGDMALITSTNKLYVYNGSAWFNIAIVNQAPTAISGTQTSYTLATDGTPTVVTLTSTDPEGFPLTWSATTSSDTQVGTVTNVGNIFTITPSTDELDVGTLSVTFSVTDGNNTETSISNFTLAFLSPYWNETVLSIGTSSADGLDNGTFIDRSTNAHTVTPTGTPTQTSFHPYLDNWSVELDGSGDYLSVADDASLDVEASDFTIEAWIYTPSPSTTAIFFNKRANASTYGSVYLGLVEGNIVAAATSNGSSWDVIPTNSSFGAISANTWHHVAVVRNGTTFTGYLDGVGTTLATSSDTILANSTPVHIGSDTDQFSFSGYIANARLVKGTAVYTTNFTPPTENFTAVTGTSLLTCQSNRFIDNSTNGHTITVNGDPKVSAFNPFGQESEYAIGENKGSTYFDGSGDYLSIADNDDFHIGAGDFTIEGWLYKEDKGNWSSIIGQRQAANAEWRIILDISGTSTYTPGNFRVDWGANYYNFSGANIPNRAWTHFALVRSGTSATLYINGTAVSTNTFNNVSNFSAPLRIGTNDGSGEYYLGNISDLRLVNGTAVYTSNFTPPTAPVGSTNASLYLPMDNPGIFDKTSNNALTLAGNVSTSTTQTKFADTAIYFGGAAQTDYIRSNKLFGEYFSAAATEIFTIEAWINLEQNNAFPTYQWHNAAIFAIEPSYLVFGVDVNNKIVFYHNDGSQRNWTPGSNTINLNTWYHVAVCSDGAGGLKTFVNGVQDATGTYYGLQSASSTATMDLGASGFQNSNERAFQGYIENFQLLKGVAKYTTTFTPPNRTQGLSYQAES